MTNPPVDSTQLTRQQLEELDVLLQRMLAMTQKACAEDASINNITSLSNPREFVNNPTVDIGTTMPHGNIDTIHASHSDNLGVSSKSENHQIIPSKTIVLSCPYELPLAEELEEDQSQKCKYYNNAIILYPLVYINCIYIYVCQYLGSVGSVLLTRIARFLFGILGIVLLGYTLLWYVQSQKFLSWTISVPWTLQDWADIIFANQHQ
jgi:hypothetical protein